ncbi:MAG: hypothetical protein LBQ54_15490 [Planctomycetaceae bacterium]|nr:hypothetical protein [Planctomycetaceae bacterium]
MPPAGRDAAAGGSVARCTALAPGLFEAVAFRWKNLSSKSLGTQNKMQEDSSDQRERVRGSRDGSPIRGTASARCRCRIFNLFRKNLSSLTSFVMLYYH